MTSFTSTLVPLTSPTSTMDIKQRFGLLSEPSQQQLLPSSSHGDSSRRLIVGEDGKEEKEKSLFHSNHEDESCSSYDHNNRNSSSPTGEDEAFNDMTTSTSPFQSSTSRKPIEFLSAVDNHHHHHVNNSNIPNKTDFTSSSSGMPLHPYENIRDEKSSLRYLLQTFFQRSNIKGGFWVTLWFLLNLIVAFGNKIVFWGGFEFPVILSLSHMIMSWILSSLAIEYYKRKAVNKSEIEEYEISPEVKKELWLYIGVFILNIIYGNISVFRTSLHMSQIVRSTVPIFVLVLSYLFMGTKTSLYKVLIVTTVIIGVILTVLHNVEISISDLVVLLIGNLFAALKTTLTNKSLKSYKIHPLVLIKFVAPFASLGMLCIALFNGEVFSLSKRYHQVEWWKGYGFVFITSVLSFFLNTTNFVANKTTSPLTMSLTANLKQVLIVVVSLTLMHEESITLLNICGIAITLSGMFLYSILSV
ncbi:hypothetical protein C9374_005182 [Naegleria lovaniensis]|uniref:Sugar phosphate transporter domain-containing protein n=1 Tax=Naegleria lovaniensis TaxID=51637 RepID=A0AA88GQE6_NAELO|nr:uncharacterized protein C9374_005182 [Naegleria lovaniensis]KAG2382602.1 hypothetical protein C9374_005182 [Naegleria lovaniensis]